MELEYTHNNKCDIVNKKNNICPKAIINIAAVKDNYLKILNFIEGKAICAAVVKNDAYGLGAQKISVSLYETGCRDFFVAYMSEAINIRRVLPLDANIYFLQGFDGSYIEYIKSYSIIPVINSVSEFNNAKGNNIPMVLHVDTGLSRLGIREDDIDIIINDIKSEDVRYVISHLACSDEIENPFNKIQKENFDRILSKIRTYKKDIKAGISASAGTLIGDDYLYDIVRIGAFLYGINPISSSSKSSIVPKNVLSLNSRILQKYELDEDVSIGYGATYKTDRKTKIAVISIGYADGIKRSLSNRGYVIFYDGKIQYKAKILGNISMDLLVCDITDIPDSITNVHDTAHILDDFYTINHMGCDANVLSYEILTSINFKSQRFDIEYII